MSTKEYGCFYCPGKSSSASGSCNQCGKPIDIRDQIIGIRLDEYAVEDVIGRGFYGWTVLAKDRYSTCAIKVVPSHRAEGRAIPDSEERSLAECCDPPHRNIARFIRQITCSVSLQEAIVPVTCLVFEYVRKSRPLRSLLDDHALLISRHDVATILVGIASGLERMHNHGLWHNDLHDDNILVRAVESDENLPGERFEAKLIDFGSAARVDSAVPEHRSRSDYYYLHKHVYALADRLPLPAHRLSAADRCFIERLHQLGHRLRDENVSRRDLTPKDLQAEVVRALTESSSGQRFPPLAQMLEESKISLKDPLANTNALDLKPQDVPLLFRDTLHWSAHIRKSEPVLIVGPRGCGKTMLLRYFSLASTARPQKGEKDRESVARRLARASEIGFIVHCSDLRNPFLRSTYEKLRKHSPDRAQEFCRDLVNTYFALEVVRALVWLASENLAVFSRSEMAPIEALLTEALFGLRAPRTRLESHLADLERRVVQLSNLPDGMEYHPSGLVNITTLEAIGKALRSLDWFAEREIWFLLDDYSATVIPEFAQAACNPMLLRPSEHVRIKITSEGDGPCLYDHLKRKYKETREFVRANLGEIYFKARETTGRKFFEDILERRFEEVGQGSLDELMTLLGEHPHEQGFGEYMLTMKRLGDVSFHGFGLICRLCSGDVSYIIDLLGHLTDGRWKTGKRIPDETQHSIIKNYADRRLADIRRTRGCGDSLYTFAYNTGNLLRSFLERSRGKKDPDERLRIEVRGTGEMSESALEMHRALLRHGVLIDGGAGKDKTGAPAMRLFFCRLLAPCFPFSPLRKGCVDIDLRQYEQWLSNPGTIWTKPPDGEHPTLALKY